MQRRKKLDKDFNGGVVEVTFVVFSSDSGYVVAKGRRPNNDAELLLVGELGTVAPGDTLRVTGSWGEHPKYGLQFRVDECTKAIVESALGVRRWMVEHLPEIGETRARQAVEKFGAAGVMHRLLYDPQALCAIDGITEERAAALHEAALRLEALREEEVWFYDHGIKPRWVKAIRKRAIELDVDPPEFIATDPYWLATLRGVSFLDVDKPVALAHFDVEKDDPRRVLAFLYEAVKQTCQREGSTFVHSSGVVQQAVAVLGVGFGRVMHIARAGNDNDTDTDNRTICVRGDWLSTKKLDDAEVIIAHAVTLRMGRGDEPGDVRLLDCDF